MSYAPIPDTVLAAIAANDSASFHAHVVSQCLDIDAFYVWTDPKSGIVCLRSVAMLAAWCAATDVLAILLGLGADVAQQSPDDQTTALHCACSNPSSSNSTLVIRALLNAGARLDVLDKHGRTARDLLSLEAGQAGAGDDEMQKDCFKTDDFRMYSFKVDLCQRLEEQHDWTTCPFMHPGEKARRRDPRTHKYDGVPCPDFRKGSCKRGDACAYAHGVFECWLHPARYRTQLCKEGALCKRGVCFFAHSMEELREPLHLHGDKAEDAPDSPKGPLTPGEVSQDTLFSRSSSPDPSTAASGSRDSAQSARSSGGDGATSALRTPVAAPLLGRPLRDARRGSFGGGSSKLRVSTESMRSVLSRSRSMCGSPDSSLSSTPVLESSLAGSLSSCDLARSFSGLSLVHEETVAAAAAAAAAAVAALGAAPSPLCQAGSAAAHWGLPGGVQVHPNDVLSYQMAAAGLMGTHTFQGAAAEFQGQVAALQQAAALQQRLAMAQAPMDSTAALLAAAGLRQPLQSLSLNLGQPHFQAGPPAYPAGCFGM